MAPATTANRGEVDEIRAYLEQVGFWRPEFAPMVAELVELRRLRADAVARAQEKPTVKGSTGQERDNPALTTALRLQEQCNKLADALLLSPRAAVRAGVTEDANPLDSFLGD